MLKQVVEEAHSTYVRNICVGTTWVMKGYFIRLGGAKLLQFARLDWFLDGGERWSCRQQDINFYD